MTSFRDRFPKHIPSAMRRQMEDQSGKLTFQDEDLIKRHSNLAAKMGISFGEYIEEALKLHELTMQWLGTAFPIATMWAKAIMADKLNARRGPTCAVVLTREIKGEKITAPCGYFADEHGDGKEIRDHVFKEKAEEEEGEDSEAFRERMKREARGES